MDRATESVLWVFLVSNQQPPMRKRAIARQGTAPPDAPDRRERRMRRTRRSARRANESWLARRAAAKRAVRPAKRCGAPTQAQGPRDRKSASSSPEPLPCGGLVYPGPPAPNFRGDESCFFDLDCSQPIEKPRIGRRNPRKSKPVFLVRFGLALVRLGGTEVLRLRPFAPGAPLHASGRIPSPGTERDPPGELQSCRIWRPRR